MFTNLHAAANARAPDVIYTSYEVANRAGVAYRTLMRWVEQGLLDPDRPNTERLKPELHWTAKHLREARVLGKMREQGISLQRVREIMAYLRSLGHNPFSTGEFLIAGRRPKEHIIVKVCEDGEIIDLVRKGQLVLPLDFGD